MQSKSDQNAVINFWFGDDSDDARVAEQKWKLWWTKADETDQYIEQRFGELVAAASAGKLDGWAATPRDLLALILVLDQFPRNIFRDMPEAFATDSKALGLALTALEHSVEQRLRPIERVFLYLPLEHSELLEHQQRCVKLMEQLAEEVPEGWRKSFEGFTSYAVAHHDIIKRFGRYPHRNAILGRESTPEEIEFLKTPGSSF